MVLRPYQQRGVDKLHENWGAGVKRQVFVLPTGGGKTVCSAHVVSDAVDKLEHVLWMAGRKELIRQAARALVENGVSSVGMISPDHHADRWAKVQVASLDTLVARGWRPKADLIVFDECQHSPAATYRELLLAYPDARVLGLTATPARGDGKALGDLFEALVVGAKYSELIADGFIVPCRVFQSPKHLGRDLAQKPLDGFRMVEQKGYAGLQWFAFAGSVRDAEEQVGLFRMAGIKAALVTGKTAGRERDRIFADFRAGRFQVLWNVNVASEGTDVPEAAGVLLSGPCGNAMIYLQRVGRALRAAPGKTTAVLLDLVGVSLPGVYDVPTVDREYSLEGRPITVAGTPLKSCPKCGSTIPASLAVCDSTMPDGTPCLHVFQGTPRKAPKVWNLELQEAIDAAGGDVKLVAKDAKLREAEVLLKLARTNGYDVLWAVQKYRKTFGDKAFPKQLLSAAERRFIYEKFVAQGKAAKWKPVAARVKYKALMGEWPD